MGKFRATLRTNFGEISVEGETKEELSDLLQQAMALVNELKNVAPQLSAVSPSPSLVLPALKKDLEGIIEVTADDRPHIVVSPEKLIAKDVINLLLYWKHPEGFSLTQLVELVSNNWKAVKQSDVAANMAGMKGLIIKEGTRGAFIYKLSGAGKSWVESNLLPKLKGKKNE
jgi:hypothetical protein